MEFYEKDIEVLTRQIKMLEESSDPSVLKSDKIYYELEKERVEAELDAWRCGKPLAEGRRIERLLKAMGFQWINFAQNADRSPKYMEYKKIIERMGFPEKFCDRTVAALPMCEIGDLPKPQVIFNPIHACDAHWLVDNSLARWHNVPVFNLDVGLDAGDKESLATLNFIADQLGEFIEWAEKKVPTVKYDEAKHIEIIEEDAIGLGYLGEIYQLKKHVPCPVSAADGFKNIWFPRRYPNIRKGNEYLRILRDELGENVASGKGPYREERLRLIWAGYEMTAIDPSRVLMERKVAMPLMFRGDTMKRFGLKYPPYGEVSEYGVKLTPLQEEARWLDKCCWDGPGKRWVTNLLYVARDMRAHGIVQFFQLGCTPILGLGSMLAERAEKELGIPVLNLEGRQLDKEYMTQKQFDEILSRFIDKCFDRAGKPRQ